MEATALLLIFLGLAVVGVPVAVSLGVSSLCVLFLLDISLTAYFSRAIAGIDVFSLLALPFFVFVGELLTGGGMSRRIVSFAEASFGWIRGGLGLVNVGGSIFFAGISGSSAADTAAIGGVLIPEMKRAGYKPEFAAAVTASSATIGSLIPPSVLLIIYGGISGLSVGSLFLAGVGPGLLVGVALLVSTWLLGRSQVPLTATFSLAKLVLTGKRAILAAGLPALLVYGILSGLVTATEGGVLAVAYSLVVGKFVYRELSWSDIGAMSVRTATFTGALLFLLANAVTFAWVLTYLQVPAGLLSLLVSLSDSRLSLFLVLLAFLLFLGMFIDTISAAIIAVPLLSPIGATLGLDPLHFGLIVAFSLLVGTVTPPVGILIFICAGIADIEVARVFRAAAPFIAILLVCVMIVAFIPAVSLWIPSLVG